MKKIYLYSFSFVLLFVVIDILCENVLLSNIPENLEKGSFLTLNEIDTIYPKDKHRGAHVFGSLDSSNVCTISDKNIEWITMVSWGSQSDFDSPEVVYFRGDSLKAQRRDSTWKSQIDIAHSAGFNVFLKPHIWIHSPTDKKWRSDIYPSNENDWKLWKKTYREFILLFAKIAQENDVEMFSVGTELSSLTDKKPEYWKSLIREVREVYDGQITYAANWYNEYEEITFWEELDYIGVQA